MHTARITKVHIYKNWADESFCTYLPFDLHYYGDDQKMTFHFPLNIVLSLSLVWNVHTPKREGEKLSGDLKQNHVYRQDRNNVLPLTFSQFTLVDYKEFYLGQLLSCCEKPCKRITTNGQGFQKSRSGMSQERFHIFGVKTSPPACKKSFPIVFAACDLGRATP